MAAAPLAKSADVHATAFLARAPSTIIDQVRDDGALQPAASAKRARSAAENAVSHSAMIAISVDDLPHGTAASSAATFEARAADSNGFATRACAFA